MYELAIRDDLARQGRQRIEIANDALCDLRRHLRVNWRDRCVTAHACRQLLIANLMLLDVIETRNIYALDAGELAQNLRTRRTPLLELAMPERDFHVELFTLPHEDEIEERCERLGVVRTGTTAHNARLVLPALVGMQRDAGKIKKLEDVRGTELVRQGDADEIEIAHGCIGLEGRKRQPMLAHEGDHVDPGQIGTLAVDMLVGVEAIVENGDGLVCLADLVRVRIHEHRMIIGTLLLGRRDAAPLLAQIARGLLDPGEKRHIALPQIEFLHVVCLQGRF